MEEMMFFDKDHIPDDIFEELKTFVFNPLFDPDLVRQVSLSATNVCIWIHAVYKYAHIHRNMQPRLRNLLEHEDKFTQVCYLKTFFFLSQISCTANVYLVKQVDL